MRSAWGIHPPSLKTPASKDLSSSEPTTTAPRARVPMVAASIAAMYSPLRWLWGSTPGMLHAPELRDGSPEPEGQKEEAPGQHQHDGHGLACQRPGTQVFALVLDDEGGGDGQGQ